MKRNGNFQLVAGGLHGAPFLYIVIAVTYYSRLEYDMKSTNFSIEIVR